MITKVSSILDNGEILEIDLRSSMDSIGLLVTSITGIGGPKSAVNILDGLNYDGGVVNSVKVQTRTINIAFNVVGTGQKEEDARKMLYKFFPSKRYITLRIETNVSELTGRTYNIQAVVEHLDFVHFGPQETATVMLYCAFPYFSDDLPSSKQLSVKNGRFTFPFSNEHLTNKLIILGDITTFIKSDIMNDGNTETGFVIEWLIMHEAAPPSWHYGPVTVSNSTTGKAMTFDTSKILPLVPTGRFKAFDKFILDTRKGRKSFSFTRLSTVTTINCINYLNFSDGWLTLLPGMNEILSSVNVPDMYNSSPNDIFAVTVSHTNLYEGV
jgi:hypothetical protein